MITWTGKVPHVDDFGDDIDDVFIDGATIYGPWAYMTPKSHAQYGRGLGIGRGQMYRNNAGQWLKVK
jgi:hypothetical protein